MRRETIPSDLFAVPCDRVLYVLSLIVGEIPYVSEYQEPQLSTVEHDFERIAFCAFDSIEKWHRGEKIPLLQEMPYLLHKRKSVGIASK